MSNLSQAADALALLSPDEQTKARKFHFLRDAKLSVASSLLKRSFAHQVLNIPFSSARYGRIGNQTHGKPCLMGSHGEQLPVDFNVSHQAGLVALAGCASQDTKFGVDIVCVNERDNHRLINREGFDRFVDMHAEVFSRADLGQMKDHVSLQGQASLSSDQRAVTDAKLRRFFAFWCLKEAYIKLEGEGLLNPWLKEVDFRNLTCPSAADKQQFGEIVDNVEVYIREQRVEDVKLVLQAYEDNYMIGTAIKQIPSVPFVTPKYETLDLVKDVYPRAA